MEILAPAGSISALKAAIKGGADAVYLGLGEHNARIKSNDFNTDNLSEWVGYAHLFGVKVYVTLNTAVKNDELSRVLSIAQIAVESGADALIVSDLGVASVLSECSNIPLHLSTQAGVQNSYDVRALQGLRIKRVILARETPFDQIKEIKKYVEEVEVFVQGAMCISFSGGCLLGSKMYGASGNRGVCNQGCRLTYTATDENGRTITSGKLLSPCDLSIGEKVRELALEGVDSVKIEGRLKRPQYVYSATKYYRDLIDGKDSSEAFRDLSESFNRGFTDGYTLKKSKKIINPLTSSHLGVPVGTIERLVDRKGYKYALIRSEYDFVKGDGAKILRKGVEVGGSDVTSVRRVGDLQEIPVSDGVAVRDVVCLTTNARKVALAERIVNTLPLDLFISGGIGEKVTVRASARGQSVTVESASLAERSRSVDNASLIAKLSKFGGTDFALTSLTDALSSPVYLNPSELAEMRRNAVSLLRDRIISVAKPNYAFERYAPSVTPREQCKKRIVLEVEDVSDANDLKADAFVLDPMRVEVATLRDNVQRAGGLDCYLRLPRILRESELSLVTEILKKVPKLSIYTDNLYGVTLARELGRRYIVGFGLNIFNDKTVSLFNDADFVARSVEVDGAIGDLAFSAGKVRLMNFAHCPFSVVYGYDCASCRRSESKLYYHCGDRRYVILRHHSASCDFTLFEDSVSRYTIPKCRFSAFYSFIGLNHEEKRAMMNYISEGKSE